MNYVTAVSRTAQLPQVLPTFAAYLLFVKPPEVSGGGGVTAPHGEAGSWAQRRSETSGSDQSQPARRQWCLHRTARGNALSAASDPGGPGPVSPSPP